MSNSQEFTRILNYTFRPGSGLRLWHRLYSHQEIKCHLHSNLGVTGICVFDDQRILGRFKGGKCLLKKGGEHFGLQGECSQTKASDECVWQKDKLLQEK